MRTATVYACLLLAFSLVAARPAAAADVPLEFDNPVLQQRYDYLLQRFRCLVCQNENLAMSQADLAQDLRQEVYNMVAQGRTNQEISDYLVARYGDFVLYDPPLQSSTWLLWFGPFIILIIGLVFMLRFVRSRRTAAAAAEAEDAPADRQRLQRLLQEPDRED